MATNIHIPVRSARRCIVRQAATKFTFVTAPIVTSLALALSGPLNTGPELAKATSPAGNPLLRASATSSGALEKKVPFRWRQPAWSPNGTTLAFGGGSVGSRGLFRSTPTGKHLRAIALDRANYSDPEPQEVEWAPHGTKIAWAERRLIDTRVPTIFVSDASRRGKEQVARGAEIAWAPSGSLIAYAGSIGIHLVRPTGKWDRRLTSGHFDDDPTWSPHGGYIAFSRRTSPEGSSYAGFIYVMRRDGTGLHKLTTRVSSAPSWSPDGRQIAYIGGVFGGADNGLYVIDADGTNERLLSSSPEGSGPPIAWSPDGSALAFTRYPGTEAAGEIVIVSRDGSSQRLLVPNGDEPAWSPNGKKLAYAGSARGCAWYGVFVVDTRGGKPRRVTPCRR
jgi:Tol biopolymer transport system component